jgi:hypothetical protein
MCAATGMLTTEAGAYSGLSLHEGDALGKVRDAVYEMVNCHGLVLRAKRQDSAVTPNGSLVRRSSVGLVPLWAPRARCRPAVCPL